MPISLTCSGCQAVFGVPESLGGKTIRCTKCKAQMVVPAELDAPIVEARVARPSEPSRPRPAGQSPPQGRALEPDFDDEERRSRRTRPRQKSSGDMRLLVGVVFGLFLLVGGGIVVYSLRTGSGNSSGDSDSGLSAQSAGWVEIPDAARHGYTVRMPKAPSTNRTIGAGMGQLPVEFDSCFHNVDEGEQEAFLAASLKLPVTPPEGEQRQILQNFMKGSRQGMAPQANGKINISEPRELLQDGFPAIEVKLSSKSGSRGAGLQRVVLAGDRMFFVMVLGEKFRTDDKMIRMFIDSFKVTYKPGGSEPRKSPSTPPKIATTPTPPPPPRGTPPVPPPSAEPEWQAVADADGFEAEMPGRVNHFGSHWHSFRSSEIFSVEHSRVRPMDLLMRTRQTAPHGLAASYGMSIKGEADVTVGSVTGKEYRYASPDDKNAGVLRVFTVGDRLYTVAVAVRGEGTKSEKLKRFLDSFKLTYTPPPTLAGNTGTQQPPNGLMPRPGLPNAATGTPTLTARIEPFWAIAVVPTKNEAVTVGMRVSGTAIAQKAAGTLRRYSYPDFKLKGTYQIPNLASDVVIDEAKGLMYLTALTKAESLVLSNMGFERSYGDGTIQVFDLNAILEGKVAERADVKPLATMAPIGKPVAIDLSPDGKWLYCLSEAVQTGINAGYRARLTRFDTAKRTAEKEITLPEPTREMARSADGSRMYLTEWPVNAANLPVPGKPAGVVVMDLANWSKLPTIPLPGFTFDLTLSPAGKLLASTGAADRNRLNILDPDGSPSQELRPGGVAQNGYAHFTPDGKTLVVSSVYGRGGVDVYDVSDPGKPDGYSLKKSYNPTDEAPLTGYFRISPDGTRAFFNTGAILEVSGK